MAFRLPTVGGVVSHLPIPASQVRTRVLLAQTSGAIASSNMHNPLLAHAATTQQHAMTDATAADLTPRGNPLPPVVHARAAPAGRIICIGDVHGCVDEFRDLLHKCDFRRSRDTLVLVGDLVNKGPDSAAVVSEARHLGALAVRGNHDDAGLAAYLEHRAGRPVKDKHFWVKGLKAEDAEWLSNLPFTLCLRDTLLVAHAGLVPGVPRKEQKLQDLYTMRDIVPRNGGGWQAREEHTSTGQPWAKVWGGPQHVLFGHDAKRRLQLRSFATGLDTGCVYGGQLTACVLPPAPSNSLFSRVTRLLGHCLTRGASPASALTLQQLGGKIVSVPSRQLKSE